MWEAVANLGMYPKYLLNVWILKTKDGFNGLQLHVYQKLWYTCN